MSRHRKSSMKAFCIGLLAWLVAAFSSPSVAEEMIIGYSPGDLYDQWGRMVPRQPAADRACRNQAGSPATLPPVAERPRAAVGRRVRGELAVELGEQRDPVGEAKLRAGRGERGVLCREGAVDDEARAGKRLEHRRQRGVAHPIVRPGEPSAQRQHRVGIDRQHPIEARAQLAPGIGRVASVEGEREAAAD